MTFKVEQDNLYRIEKSPKTMHQQTLKVCECVVRSGRFLNLIEAKTNVPNPHNEEHANLDEFYRDIERKFIDTLLFTIGITTKRHSDETCPLSVKEIELSGIKYRFYLIIKNLEDRYLPDHLSCFKKQMKHITKAWKIDDDCLKVFNEAEARRKKLIL